MIFINTGIYIRVSTEEQVNNGYSIRAQEEKLVSFCKIKDWNIYNIYIDEGLSGKNISERNNLLLLINDIKLKNVNNVLVYKIDRLTRSTKDLIDLIEFFNSYNCSFNSLCESIDTRTSTGRMFIKIIGIFAEFERENIIERVKLGLERKVREGFSIASKNISFGYKKNKGDSIQRIVSSEALVVNEIYDMFIKKRNYSYIARYLNSKGIRTKNNNKWSYKTVKLVLSNPNYVGRVRYGINTDKYFEVCGKHDSIISIDKYNKVQDLINSKSSSFYIKFIFCKCGNTLSFKKYSYNSKKGISFYNRYVCNNKNCSFKSISEKRINYYFNLINLNWNKLSFLEKSNWLELNIKKIIVIDNYINVIRK